MSEKKRHLDRERLRQIVEGHEVEREELSKFYRVGPKSGPHLMVSRAEKVTLIYGYGFQYAAPGVRNFSEEERREMKLGGIACQLEIPQIPCEVGGDVDGASEMLYESFRGMVLLVESESRRP